MLALAGLLVAGCGTGNATPGLATPRPTSTPVASASEPQSAAHSVGATASRPPAGATDWPVYHGDAGRTGVASSFPQPTGSPAKAWTAALDGAVYGQPLGVNGRVIAATENDSVYALDPAGGAVIWHVHLGEPVPLSSLPCGNIDPLGITGTAAYDATTDTIFVVAEVTGPRHVLFALDPSAGEVRWSRGLDMAGDDPSVYQQRAALAVGNGMVYIGFGGLDGDCGQYRGVVVGVPASGDGATIGYRVPVQREGGVWAAGGPVLDSSGNVYVATGNGSSTSAYDGSDSVLELSPALELESRFTPRNWAEDNASDRDLGSMSPVLVGGEWVLAAGKSGTAYVLREGALGGIGGEVSSAPVCASFGAAAVSGSTAFLPCTDGIRAVTVDASGHLGVAWHTSTGANGPPVLGGGVAWCVATDSGTLFALSQDSGKEIGHVALGAVPHFASPTLWHDLVLVGTMLGVTAVRP